MFHKAGALAYDPQFIRPPAGYRGADAISYGDGEARPPHGTKGQGQGQGRSRSRAGRRPTFGSSRR